MKGRVVNLDGLSKTLETLKFRPALILLLEGHAYAAEFGESPWEFAVEAGELCRKGISINDLRFLARLGFVDHAQELPANGSASRRFRRSKLIGRNTCFVLSQVGIDVVCGKRKPPLAAARSSLRIVRISANKPIGQRTNVPFWDRRHRVLSFGDEVVKQFKCRAVNQERVLSAFQEEGWPTRIDDPLVPLPAVAPKKRLSDAIVCLNRHQIRQLLRFRGDGTGEGVLWETVPMQVKRGCSG